MQIKHSLSKSKMHVVINMRALTKRSFLAEGASGMMIGEELAVLPFSPFCPSGRNG
jgi:hypothetical protein